MWKGWAVEIGYKPCACSLLPPPPPPSFPSSSHLLLPRPPQQQRQHRSRQVLDQSTDPIVPGNDSRPPSVLARHCCLLTRPPSSHQRFPPFLLFFFQLFSYYNILCFVSFKAHQQPTSSLSRFYARAFIRVLHRSLGLPGKGLNTFIVQLQLELRDF